VFVRLDHIAGVIINENYTIISGGDPDFIIVRPSPFPGWDLRPISSRPAISDIQIPDEFACQTILA